MGVQRLLKGKKGAESFQSSSGAAFFILLIMVFIVFYILFLPPSDRAALLDDGTVPGTPPTISGGYDHLVGTTPFSANVGKITYIPDSIVKHDLASFTIHTDTNAGVVVDKSMLYIKNSAFEKKSEKIPFDIDKKITKNLKLSFNVEEGSGTLKIFLNGEIIFDGPLNRGSPTPIELPKNLLKDNNILYFAVSSPGFAFWTMNEYTLKNILVTGDITDDSNNFNVQKVYLAKSEYNNIKKATLEFFPDCSENKIGHLSIILNGQRVYNGIPDCGLKNFFEIGTSVLTQGENRLEFLSDTGSYIIDMVQLEVSLKKPEYPIYYFDLNEDLFVTKAVGDKYCGKVDGFCPSNCESYEDKDCCFDESSQNYWCDVETTNPHDRCVNEVLASYANNCPSGYEDRYGKASKNIEGLCGDDNDNYCPPGCNQDYDKDCCYAAGNGNYWCDDIPFTGRDSVCTPSITASECNACPDGYKSADGHSPNCPTMDYTTNEAEPELKSGVKINLEAYFTDKEYKKVDFVINGYEIPVDTYNTKIYRNINAFVHDGTNSLEIKPRKDVSISQVKVKIE